MNQSDMTQSDQNSTTYDQTVASESRDDAQWCQCGICLANDPELLAERLSRLLTATKRPSAPKLPTGFPDLMQTAIERASVSVECEANRLRREAADTLLLASAVRNEFTLAITTLLFLDAQLLTANPTATEVDQIDNAIHVLEHALKIVRDVHLR